jgi:hypothetical protein
MMDHRIELWVIKEAAPCIFSFRLVANHLVLLVDSVLTLFLFLILSIMY